MAAKALAKAQREGAREHAARVNELKRCIDELKVGLETKCQLRRFYFSSNHSTIYLFVPFGAVFPRPGTWGVDLFESLRAYQSFIIVSYFPP